MATTTWLRSMLERRGVAYEELQHLVAARAQQTAHGPTVGAEVLAKVVVALADGRLTALILPSSRRVVLDRVGKLLGADFVCLVPETDIEVTITGPRSAAAAHSPACHSITMLMDATLINAGALVLQEKTLDGPIRLTLGDWLWLTNPGVGYFTEPDH